MLARIEKKVRSWKEVGGKGGRKGRKKERVAIKGKTEEKIVSSTETIGQLAIFSIGPKSQNFRIGKFRGERIQVTFRI